MQYRRLASHPALGWLVFLWLSAGEAAGAEPTLRTINLRSLQIGGTVSLVIDGESLGLAPRLFLPFPAKQELQPKSTDTKATIDVTLAPDVPPGFYHLRVLTEEGISAPLLIAVDALPQKVLSPAVETLPVALHGSVTGSTTVEAKFQGKAGQKVLVEVEAQRLGSKLRPILHLVNPKGLELAWSWPTPARFGDVRLEATLPEDGVYSATVHDQEYAGPAPGFFRLKIGQWSYVDQVFPSVVGKGSKNVELSGSTPVLRVDLPSVASQEPLPLAWPKSGLWSGLRPFVSVSPHPEVVEQTTAGKAQELPSIPVGISGRLGKAFEEDRYLVTVAAGMKLRLEVFAERLGSPVDAALVIRNESGDQIIRGEDGAGTLDPVLDFTVPAKTTKIMVGVQDAQGRGGPAASYRLVVSSSQKSAGGGFELFTPAQQAVLPPNGRSVIPVHVARQGYSGKIELTALELPSGIRLEGTTIPEEADGALVTVQRGAGGVAPAVTLWRGKGAALEQTVVIRGHPMERLQPWLAREIVMAPAIFKAPEFQVDWNSLPADAGLIPAGKLTLPVKVTRADDKTVVRFTLLTSQAFPENNKPDPNLTLRLEKAVEMGPKAVDTVLSMVVPPLLNGPLFDLSIQAELLTADKKTVLATSFAPVRRLKVRHQVVVTLDGPSRLEVPVDPAKGGVVKLQGKIERREGLTNDVTLTLTGLPAGAKADAVNVKAGATAFVMNVNFPPNTPPGEIEGLKLTGSAAPDPKQAAIRVRSRDLEVTLVLK